MQPSILCCCLLLTSASRWCAAFLQPTPHSLWSRKFATTDGAQNDSNDLLQVGAQNDGNDLLQVAPEISSSAAFEDDLFLERFKRRRDEAASKIEAERQHRPPSNSTHFAEPKNVVTSILDGMLRPHEPVKYFGYEILYSSSTPHWKDVLRKSVGAPIGTEEELIFRALSTSMERANNQFGILVGLGTDHDDYDDDMPSSKAYYHHDLIRHDDYYTIEFPWDTLDYYDGTAWVECRLRDKQSDELFVVLGWSMQRRESDGAWLIDGIDWQDFRLKYRPGIGREEWERICG